MRLEEGLDVGGIYAEERVPIGATITADELREQLTEVGCRLLVKVLDRPLVEWIDTAVLHTLRDAMYAAKLAKGDSEIDWARPELDVSPLGASRRRVDYVSRQALEDPRCRTSWMVVLVPTVVQPEGKAPMALRCLAQRRPTGGRRIVRYACERLDRPPGPPVDDTKP